MAQIVLDHVDKVYPGGVKALDDLCLQVREGEFMVLVAFGLKLRHAPRAEIRRRVTGAGRSSASRRPS